MYVLTNRGSGLENGGLVGVVLIVAQYLLDVDDLRAGVPSDATAHEIRLSPLVLDATCESSWRFRCIV